MLSCAGLSVASAIPITFTAAPSGNAGLWTATVNSISGVQLVCDDYAHTTKTGVSYNYDQSVIDGPNPLQNVRFRAGDELQNYRAAAILLSQLISAAPAAVVDYQYALWSLFTSTTPVDSHQTDLKNEALARAGNLINGQPTAADADIYSRLIIYTPSAYQTGHGKDPQEFLGWTPVPEPSQAVGLLAVLGLGWFVRRRRMA